MKLLVALCLTPVGNRGRVFLEVLGVCLIVFSFMAATVLAGTVFLLGKVGFAPLNPLIFLGFSIGMLLVVLAVLALYLAVWTGIPPSEMTSSSSCWWVPGQTQWMMNLVILWIICIGIFI